MSSIAEGERLLTVAEVCDLTKMSRAMLYSEMARDRFPRPLKVGNKSIRWRLSDLDNWIGGLSRASADIGGGR